MGGRRTQEGGERACTREGGGCGGVSMLHQRRRVSSSHGWSIFTQRADVARSNVPQQVELAAEIIVMGRAGGGKRGERGRREGGGGDGGGQGGM